MVISWLIILASIICIIRMISFGKWCIKDKNICGAISVFFLILCVILSVIIMI